MSFRLAAYAVCLDEDRVLLARHVAGNGETTWTLPGGGVEHGEDPFDAVTRELLEETGYNGVIERLLGVDSRVIPAAVAHAGSEPTWTPTAQVAYLRRSSLVDTGLALAQTLPPSGHVPSTPVGGLIQH